MSEAERSAEAAACATHEGRPSTGTCARCGNFVCELCLDASAPLPDHCEACRQREGGGQIAWERDEGPWPRRWWRTSRDVVFSPTRTFERARPGPPSAALRHAAITAGVVGAVLGALAALALTVAGLLGALDGFALDLAGGSGPGGVALIVVGSVLIYALAGILGVTVSVAFRTLVFHLGARALGGQGGFGVSLWSVCYLHAITVATLPTVVLQQIPLVGIAISLLTFLLVETWYALQLTTVARRYHGLSGGRATMAGWTGFVLIVGLMTTCCLLGAILVVVEGAGLP